jgi:uncharacterized membrane protein YphA (DoxX/SURF4 family)
MVARAQLASRPIAHRLPDTHRSRAAFVDGSTVSFQFLAGVWYAFFFAPESPVVVCVFRIAFAALLLVDALFTLPEAQLFYGPAGIFSIEDYRRGLGRSRFSLFNYLPASEWTVWLVLGLEVVASLSLLVGFLTGVSAFLAFVTLTSLHQRNPFALHSGDTILRLLCLLLVFAPAGAVLSIDAWLAGAGGADPSAPWAVRLMQILLATIYMHSLAWKLRGQWWRDGSAVYWALTAGAYRRHDLPVVLRRRWVYAFGTYSTLMIEGALAGLIWISELRYLVLVAGAIFHLTLEYFMRIRLFQWTMLVGLVLFVKPTDMSAAVHLVFP